MLYCVVPRDLEGELFEQLRAHYAGEADVTVIVDRREGDRRRRGRASAATRQRRELRDRRRRRAVGEFAPLHGEALRSA